MGPLATSNLFGMFMFILLGTSLFYFAQKEARLTWFTISTNESFANDLAPTLEYPASPVRHVP